MAGDDPAALRAVRETYVRWAPLVHTLALRALADTDLAERVTTQVFVELAGSVRGADVGSPAVGRRLVDLACVRIAEARAPSPSADDESNPGSSAERLMVADALAHLEPTDQQVLRMVLGDVGPAEVAARTGLSVQEVRRRGARGLVELSERWEGQTDARRR